MAHWLIRKQVRLADQARYHHALTVFFRRAVTVRPHCPPAAKWFSHSKVAMSSILYYAIPYCIILYSSILHAIKTTSHVLCTPFHAVYSRTYYKDDIIHLLYTIHLSLYTMHYMLYHTIIILYYTILFYTLSSCYSTILYNARLCQRGNEISRKFT